jgi:hypothetical protein
MRIVVFKKFTSSDLSITQEIHRRVDLFPMESSTFSVSVQMCSTSPIVLKKVFLMSKPNRLRMVQVGDWGQRTLEPATPNRDTDFQLPEVVRVARLQIIDGNGFAIDRPPPCSNVIV